MTAIFHGSHCFYRSVNASVSEHTHSASVMYLKAALAVKHMALLKNMSITSITATAIASAAVRWERIFLKYRTARHSFEM